MDHWDTFHLVLVYAGYFVGACAVLAGFVFGFVIPGAAAANPNKAEAVGSLISGYVFAGSFFAGGVVIATIAAILHRQLL